MNSKTAGSIPSYRRPEPSGKAIVTLSGKMFYPGEFGSRESRIRYSRLVQQWEENGRSHPPDEEARSAFRLNDLMNLYLEVERSCADGDPNRKCLGTGFKWKEPPLRCERHHPPGRVVRRPVASSPSVSAAPFG